MRPLIFLVALLVSATAFSQKFGMLLVSDYDDPALALDGVFVWSGDELLGTTDNAGSFYFPHRIKGTVTLKRAGYVDLNLRIKAKENTTIDTNLMVTAAVYDSLKQAAIPEIYRSCIDDTVTAAALSGTSADAFGEYVERMMHYPNRARDARISGTVKLRFRVSETGDVDCIEIVKGAHYELDKEALRILSYMPQWKPAKHNGLPVAKVYTASILFQLQ